MPRAASRPLARRSCRTLGPVSCAATRAALVKLRAASVRSSSAQNASKRPCKFHAISSATVARHEAFPRPPVRWRSAHRRCFGSQLLRHGRPERPSVSAGRLLAASRRSQSVSRLGRVLSPSLRGLAGPSKLTQWNARLRWPPSSCNCSLQWPSASLLRIPACRHLTTPSSGRSKGRFAPFAPPLISNVGPLV